MILIMTAQVFFFDNFSEKESHLNAVEFCAVKHFATISQD